MRFPVGCQGLSRGEGLALGVDDVAPVQVAPVQAQHQHFGGGQIAGKGDVVLVAQAGDIGNIVIGVLLVGIAWYTSQLSKAKRTYI